MLATLEQENESGAIPADWRQILDQRAGQASPHPGELVEIVYLASSFIYGIVQAVVSFVIECIYNYA